MMKRSFFLITIFMFCALIGQAQNVSVYIYDTDGPFTNVRSSPKGKVVDKIPVDRSATLLLTKATNGWWRIVDNCYGAFDEDGDFVEVKLKGSTTGYWIHYSTIAVGTRNYGGEDLPLRSQPSKRASVSFTLKGEQLVRPIDVKGDWVKVKTLDGRGTGWIEVEWLCDNPLTNCC
ncbi:MAG: SH3 domain-containing protein [Prevotella sp.]|nr:SH3 domain-containing protein [Prevotella sp.]